MSALSHTERVEAERLLATVEGPSPTVLDLQHQVAQLYETTRGLELELANVLDAAAAELRGDELVMVTNAVGRVAAFLGEALRWEDLVARHLEIRRKRSNRP